jgi:hypothetical protein
MTTVLVVGNSDGSRRCDATCHRASEPTCVCICGGRYHGKAEQAPETIQRDIAAGVFGEDVRAAAQALTEQQELAS